MAVKSVVVGCSNNAATRSRQRGVSYALSLIHVTGVLAVLVSAVAKMLSGKKTQQKAARRQLFISQYQVISRLLAIVVVIFFIRLDLATNLAVA